jgi:hypothetical protein
MKRYTNKETGADREARKNRKKQGKREREIRDRETWRIRDREERQEKKKKKQKARPGEADKRRDKGMEESIERYSHFSKGPWVHGVDQVSEPKTVGQFLLCPI